MQTRMVVTGLTIDPSNNAPIVILREDESSRVLPIWIGVIEASAIAFELEKVRLARPMTHDLLRSAVEALGGAVQRVMIVDLRDNTYFASVVLTQGKETIEIDARPSDAIALALRASAPIFCDSSIIAKVNDRQEVEIGSPSGVAPPVNVDEPPRGGPPRPAADLDEASMKAWLEGLAPEDFGKYKM